MLKEFIALGYEAWRVPSSGALGHNPKVNVPDRVRKYLVGDVCVNTGKEDVPLEVKYRSQSPLRKAEDNVLGMGFRANTSTCIETTDLFVYFSTEDWLTSNRSILSFHRSTVLTNEMRSWYVHTRTLFLRLKGLKHWIIMELK